MESFATPYPVLFNDGKQERHVGALGLHRHLTFKRFQALLAQLTGFAANLLSVVFVYRKSLKNRAQKRQRLPVHEQTNFALIIAQHNPNQEQDCHFLVSLKKSKAKREGGSTRTRSAPALNASRGGLAHLYGGPKVRSVKEAFPPKVTFPPTIEPASSSGDGQQTRSNASRKGKLPLGVLDREVERAQLRREGAGKNLFANSSSSRGAGGAIGQRVTTSATAAVKGKVHAVVQGARKSVSFIPEGWSPADVPDHRSKTSITSLPGSRLTTASTSYAAAIYGYRSKTPIMSLPASKLTTASTSYAAVINGDRSKTSIMSLPGSTLSTTSTSCAAAITGGNPRGPPLFHHSAHDPTTKGFCIPSPRGPEFPDVRAPSPYGPIRRPVRSTALGKQ